MAVDGIGGKPKPTALRPSTSVGRSERAQFVPASGQVGAGGAVQRSGSASSIEQAKLLGQVRRGEVSLNEYLDIRVGEAVQHLHEALSQEQMDFIRSQLRVQLQDDPVLTDLVRRATGRRPEADPLPSDEEQ